MARADVIIAQVNATLQRSCQSGYKVRIPDGTVYSIFAASDSSLYWEKSVDGELTWSDAVSIKGLGGVNSGFAVWYDKWTPSDTGTKIHIVYFDQTNDDVSYRSLDTSSDTLGTEVTIFLGTSTSTPTNTCISVTKAIGGNLYCAFDIDGGTETGFYRSVDAGANWTSRTDVNEATSDYYLLAPGFAADTQDIICIFWDRSADEISRKIYDDSGNSWAETSIATSMVDLASGTAAPNFSITVDDPNNKILLAAWSAADTANADLRFWSIDESTITEGTNIVLNSTDDQGMVALALATDTSIIYAFYGGKSDGSETFPTSINIYYKSSSDGGTTWGSETQLTTITRGYDFLMTYPLFTGNFSPMMQVQSATFDYLDSSVLLPSGGASGGSPVVGSLVIN